ncbi:MAG: hypothetical protein NVSMB24_27120 [Mucilaginibacter sp.]
MRKKATVFISVLIGVVLLSSCHSNISKKEYEAKANDARIFNQCAAQLTNVIIYDIFKPPVASRIYSYAYLAAYEAMRQDHPDYRAMLGVIKEFKGVSAPEKNKTYCFALAGMVAFNKVGDELTFSKDKWDNFNEKFYPQFKNMGIPDDVYENSVAFGQKVAKEIIEFSKSDNYAQTRNFKFTVNQDPGRWVPTPPMYADACEPKWNTIRSFFIDSASQFKPVPCAPYDMNANSKYHQLLMQVYHINKSLTKEEKDIAYFWDDNAFVSNVYGHAIIATKKMTPPGHWLAIAATVTAQKKLDLMKSVRIYLISSLAMQDAFIASYDEKYRSNRIRPVTVIQASIDNNWMPFLETPSFPEYVSAHSAISAAAGTILTNLIGDNIAYSDSTENEYGHGVRSFKSFTEAYREVSDSRVYGGIHYRDGVDAGMKQGEGIGNLILKKLRATPGQ